ncbi:magnesium transporter CorA family protein [Peptoniphilus sp. KCTC 25270]|uniref:magnesium transporter CorA family protein n=1 Tax=Peptoniphilus sp. KCTC 25270 TaxID=2897414 RepID=UPI001E2EF6AD|nr:magnesium transporter CorA family protein [Peptoniphilus sp. KCTC 25270]MCD1147527.1 magnesium transporter CorA family protein [Peptoniphilus sp. KCTC 25270]
MKRQISHPYVSNTEQKKIPWIHLENPTPEEIQSIMESYPIPKDFITAGIDEDEPTRYEKYISEDLREWHLFVFLYPIKTKDIPPADTYDTLPLAIVLSEEVMITTSKKPYPLLEETLRTEAYNSHYSADTWLMDIFWAISREYICHLKEIKISLLEIEKSVSSQTENSIFYDLIGLNKGLISFEASIQGNTRLLKGLEEEAEKNGLDFKEKQLLRDIQVEHNQAIHLVYKYGSIIEKLTNILSNVINNNMNLVMKKLTIWTILLTIPTISTGFWGMNLSLPFEKNPYGVWIVTFLTVLVLFLTYWWLKNKKNL